MVFDPGRRRCAKRAAEHHPGSSALDWTATQGCSAERANRRAEESAAHRALTDVGPTAVWICRAAAEKREGEQARQKHVFH
jgi:hypothetical protein